MFFILGLSYSRYREGAVAGIVLFAIVGIGIAFLPIFDDAVDAFSTRWNSASEIEGGIASGTFGNRFAGDFLGTFTILKETPVSGFGLGLGTNVGAKLLTGERSFLLAESEWQRTVAEMGGILGLALIAVRVSLAVAFLRRAVASLMRGNSLPVFISSIAALWLVVANWAQPTSLGFTVVASGLALAATRIPVVMPRPLPANVADSSGLKKESV